MEFQSSVSDFDLNLLAPPPKKQLIPNKLLKKSSVSYVKTKILLTHKVVQKHNLMKLELNQTEKELENSREECRNICNDYRACLEQRTELENKCEELRNENKLIAERCFNAETHYGGLQSHIKQLQVLITEYENEIRDLKSELKARKDATPPVRQNKKSAVLNKENAVLKKHIACLIDVIPKKTKVNNTIQNILVKYRDPKSDDGNRLEHEGSCEDDFEDVPLFYSEETSDTVIITPTPNITTPVVCNTAINRNNSIESEIIDGRSVDTGRGSSLAFSDGEKSFHSPEYYMGDSPLSSETVQNNENAKSFKDSSTSPMVNTPQCRDNCTSPMLRNAICRDCSTSPMPIHRKTVATSPIIFERNTVHIVHDPAEKVERGVSPIKIVESWASKNNRGVKELRHVAVDTKSLAVDVNNRYTTRNERECLERNNSVILSENCQNDLEVEMILSEMRLHQQLVTPIPQTPIVSNRIHKTSDNRMDESVFEITGKDSESMFRKLDAVYDLVFSMKERLPHLFNTQADVTYPLESTSHRKICNANLEKNKKESSKVSKNVVENKEFMNTEDSVEFGEIESNNKNVTNNLCESAITNNMPKSNQANSQLYTIEEESDNDLIISEDIIETDITQHTDIQCDRVSPEPIKKLNSPESLEKPSKPLNTIRKLKKKLTGLEKMRMRYIPKAKIKPQLPTKKQLFKPKKQLFKPKKLVVPKIVTAKDTAASLNDKDVYEKAVKVMAELKTNACKKIPTVVVEDCSKKITLLLNPQKDNNNSNTNSEVFSSPHTNSIKSSEHNDKAQNSNNSAGLMSKERRNSVKRVSISKLLIPHKETNNKNGTIYSEVHSSPETSATKSLEHNDKARNNNSAVSVSKEHRKSVKNIFIDEMLSLEKEPLVKNGKTNSDIHSFQENNAAKLEDKMQNHHNTAGLISNERRKSVKRISISETEPVESKRVLRPRQKSNVSLTDETIPTEEHVNNSESNKTKVSEPCVTPIKRRRLRSRQSSDESTNSCDKTTPTKRSTTSNEPNVLSPSQRLLRSSIRKEHEIDKRADETANTDLNLVHNDSGIDNNCNISNKINTRVSSCGTYKRKKSTEDQVENANSSGHTNKTDSNNVAKFKSQIDYADLDLFSAEADNQQILTRSSSTKTAEQLMNPKESLLCSMIEKYGVTAVNFFTKKPSETVTNKICEKLEKDIEHINKLNAPENKYAMIQLVTHIQQLDIKEFIVGFIKYLKHPDRKAEMYNVIVSHPAPSMTKSEQVLLFLIAELRNHWRGVDLVNDILNNIEYALFNLNRSPEFHMIESMAHFYAVLCRYYRMKSRLRLFVLDSLYCLQFKAVPLIKQCIEVWMHILPLAHMGIAKIPLVTCLVYLLHFYKCEDKFNRVQELRIILKRKYFYHVTEWNETKILDMFRTSVKELRCIPVETKMLRLGLIILGKRQGPKWCLKNIIKGILQPLIENNETPHHVKLFCISMLGPLLKPFPNDMKVHCEVVVTKLMDMLEAQPSQDVAETIFTSLIYFSKHNEMRLNRYLLKWNPPNISSEFEQVLQDYVRSKPVKAWKNLLGKCLSSD